MAVGVQTISRVLLGEALKQLRSEAGVTLDAAAKVIGKDRPRLVKVLDGKATLSTEELEALVDFFGAQDPARAEILTLGIEARKRATAGPYLDLAPGSFRRIAWLEAMAKDIWTYESGIIPMFLQSPDYIDAVLRTGEDIWWEGVRADLVAFRLERQRRVFEADTPKRVEVVLTEASLSVMVGNPEVMQGQLKYMLAMLDRFPGLKVRVVPTATAGNPAPVGGLIMLRFGEVLRPVGFLPVAYGPSVYFDEVEDTERILRAFTRLRDLALSSEDTRAFLEKKLKESK
jgi:transcriptional regulator with XRE-family HTH domain